MERCFLLKLFVALTRYLLSVFRWGSDIASYKLSAFARPRLHTKKLRRDKNNQSNIVFWAGFRSRNRDRNPVPKTIFDSLFFWFRRSFLCAISGEQMRLACSLQYRFPARTPEMLCEVKGRSLSNIDASASGLLASGCYFNLYPKEADRWLFQVDVSASSNPYYCDQNRRLCVLLGAPPK